MADRMDASIQEILARKAWLIHRIARLRAAVEAAHDAMTHLNALRSFCEDVLAADDETRCAVGSKSRRLSPICWH